MYLVRHVAWGTESVRPPKLTATAATLQGVPIERMSDVWEGHWLWRKASKREACVDRPSSDPSGNVLTGTAA